MSTDEPADGVALCLSGGGYRAMLFHVGVAVAAATTRAGCKRLDRVSSVSGGSITAGALALAWPKLDFERRSERARFVAAGRSRCARWRRTVDVAGVIVGALTPEHDLRARRRRPTAEHLFGDATLQDLPDRPRFVINATNVQSGALLRFSKPYMADWRVGRVDHADRRARRRRGRLLGLPARPLPASSSTCATSAVDRRARQRPRGTASSASASCSSDGGVYDNLGLETAWKAARPCSSPTPAARWRPRPTPTTTGAATCSACSSVIDNQVRSLRKRQCVERVQGAASARARTGASAATSPTSASPTRCPRRTRRRWRSPTLSTRLARLDAVVQERLINWGYAACDAGDARPRRPRRCPRPAAYPYPAAGIGGV